ncbi:MAG: 4Fe-4S dicluster domain-containing protein [Bacteroidales bacterium]|nr:4Fe-4S dicluster domain-containing protein [Bacteroidales bacterium]MBR6416242.1 4Fe-4S dicluster domain-containing protein [Bacteroidales bacterium]
MGKLYDELCKDYRFKEGMKTCINCGTCTAICPAAEFYKYDPRKIVDTVQRKNDDDILALLKSETIWYCGECMSCLTRCPRKNGAGLVVMALRALSTKLGYFTCSERGRQLYPLSKALNGNILNYGYCVHPETFKYEDHPESGPVMEWVLNNREEVYARVGANYMKSGPGVLRKIEQEDLDELKAIFDVSGGTEHMETIDKFSEKKAKEMGMTMEEYRKYTFEHCSPGHFNNE